MYLGLVAACSADTSSDRAEDAASPSVVSQAQTLLAELGYGAGAVDGVEGPRTAAAVSAFQTASGLEIDGRVSDALVERLAAARQARMVAQAQRQLAALGYDPGPVDGKVGTRTRAAVTAFQRARNLPSDGEVTAGLIEQLAAAGDTTDGVQAQVAALDEPSPVLGPGDRVVLSYYGAQTAAAEMEVDPDGRLALPEIGSVQAAGLDVEALRDQVTVKLIESYLGKLDVAVRLVAASGSADTTAAGAHVLSPGDRISVRILAGDSTPAELEIDSDGWLQLPEAGKLRAAGRGLTELRDDITVKLLEGYMSDLKVRVRLAEADGHTPSGE